MVENEEAYPDPRLDALLRASGQSWPRDDEELDTWLAGQELSAQEEDWLRDVVQRRVREAMGPGQAVGGRVGEPSSGIGEKGEAPSAAPALTPEATPRRRPLSADDLALLNEQLLDLVESGVSLPAGLAAYASDLKAGRLESVIGGLRRDLEAGLPLSQAMARQGTRLPPLYRALVAAGEAGGDLTTCLALLHEQAEVDSELDRRVRESLAYPAVTFGVALFGVLAVLAWIVPPFKAIFANMGVELPFVTTAVIATAEVVSSHPVLTLALTVSAFVSCFELVPRFAPRLLRRAASAGGGAGRSLGELSRALAGFLGRGLPLPAALEALAGVELSFPAGTLERVSERLQGGATLADSLRPEAVFPPTYVWLVGAAEGRGDLPEALQALARRHERSFRSRLRALEALIGPVSMLLIGVVVGLAVLSIFLPIFELQRALQQ